jgi:hypothetical protein
MTEEVGSGFQTDNLGNGSFYAAPGLYDLVPQITPPGQNYFATTVLVPVNPLDAGSGGGVGQVLMLSYWDGSGESAPFAVPVWSVPAGWDGSGTASMGAQLTVGSGGITSGVLLDADGDAIPDGFTFSAFIFVEGSTIYDIIAFNTYTYAAAAGVLCWNDTGGRPQPLAIEGGIFTPGTVNANAVVTDGFEVNGVNVFTYDGNPTGIVASITKGDLVFDTGTPAIWQATAASSSTNWEQIAGGGVIDMGTVQIQAYNYTQDIVYAQSDIAPYSSGQTPDNLVAHCPPYASDWLPLNVLDASDQMQAVMVQALAGGLWDTVDINGTLLIWDLTGANLLAASFTLTGIDSSTSPVVLTLSQEQLIGTDLSIVGGTAIESAAGGVYNVLINASANWD